MCFGWYKHKVAVTRSEAKGHCRFSVESTWFLVSSSIPSPPVDQYEEEDAQHHVADVTVDGVEGAQYTQSVGTLKVIVTDVLVTSHIQNLHIQGNIAIHVKVAPFI